MEQAEEKKYRVRVEVATVIELDVLAIHEDEAAAIAEREKQLSMCRSAAKTGILPRQK